jgi:hypothetical protein
MKQDFSKSWKFLYSLASILFSVVGLAMIIFDTRYLYGIQYLITAVILGHAFFLSKKNKINYSNPSLSLGFIFSVIGLTNPIFPFGLWGLGIILFLFGLFKK